MKSTTCKGPNGKYLEEYHSQAAASIGAERIKIEYGYDLVPQVCRTCGYWHLAPTNKTRVCMHCTDSALFHKDLYPTKQDAEAMARQVGMKTKVRLFPYKCPHGAGWHLTKGR